MATPVLTTKLYIPPFRSGLVSRPRLVDQLSHGLDQGRKLTLVSAPAGFGKTTLLSEWIHRRGGVIPPTGANTADEASVPLHVAWVSLDEGDNDLSRFLAHLVAALQQVDARLGRADQAALQAPQPPAVEPFVTALINDIAARPPGGTLVLVLDDYHTIMRDAAASQAIHRALAFLLDHMPPQLHLVIASRADPPLALSRLRVRRQITEIRATDLRFSKQEAAAFLNQVKKLDLSSQEIATLESRTEGWIAGLQLAALSMERLQDERRHTFIAALTGDDRYILDYLVEEVLDRQPAHIRTFLLRTSILARLCGPLCDAVLGGGQEGALPLSGPEISGPQVPASPIAAQQILEHLEQNNLFLVPLDNRRGWYRYHHLFADLLLNQLEGSRPDQVPTLHRRASAWYAAHSLRSEAIRHSLAAEDWERVAQLIDEVVYDVLGGNVYFTTVLSWLDALPREVVRARPQLGVVRAWMLVLLVRDEAAERCLGELESSSQGSLPDEVRLQVTTIRAFLARRRNELQKAIALCQEVLQAIEGGAAAPNLVRPMIALNLANVYRTVGDIGQSNHWYAVLANTPGAGITLTMAVVSGRASNQTVQGHLHRAAEIYRHGIRLADQASQQSGRPVPAICLVYTGLGDLLREWNQLEEAARYLERGIEMARQWQLGMALCNGYISLARLRQAQGDMAAARDLILQAEQLPQAFQTIPRYAGPVPACRARLMLALAQSPPALDSPPTEANPRQVAEQWARSRALSIDNPVRSLDDELERLVWARLLIAQGNADQALRLLAHLLQAAEAFGRTGRAIEILAIQALAYQARDDEEQALVTLERALSLAEPEGYVRTFVDEGEPMALLLRSLRTGRSASSVDYADRLLNAFGTPGVPEALLETGPEPRRSTVLPLDPLTDRETEVLRLLNTELSGPEIARELYLSVNTVKTHTKRIYEKLGAHSRYEAVERARELGLI